MATLTQTAMLALATQCGHGVAPDTLASFAWHESQYNPDAVHLNTNGTRDIGLFQINESNFSWLGLTPATALDPCRSTAAAASLLTAMSLYNTGNPTRGFTNGYVTDGLRALWQVRAKPEVPPSPTLPTPPPLTLENQLLTPSTDHELIFR